MSTPTPTAAPATMPPESVPTPAAAPPRRPLPRLLWLGGLVVLTGLAIFLAYPWWSYRQTHSITEDAFVEAHIVNVAPQVVSPWAEQAARDMRELETQFNQQDRPNREAGVGDKP